MKFKKYPCGVGDAGTRLLFKFRSGTHGLNEELGRHRGRKGRMVMLGQDYCLNSGQERMDSMKSWADIEEGKAGW